MFYHLRLCLVTAIHNLKWLKITQIILFNFRPNIGNSWSLDTKIIPNNSDLVD